MAQPVTLAVSVEPVDYEFGGWCRTCLLPSGVRVTVMVSIGSASSLRTFDRCADCLGSRVEAPEHPDAAHL